MLTQDEFIIELEKTSLKFKCENTLETCVIDISHLNLIEATKVAIFASTYCFINNFGKNLCWQVADEEIKSAISILRLRNVEQIIKKETKERIAFAS